VFAKGSLGNTYVGSQGNFCIRGGSAFHFRGYASTEAGKCSAQGGNLLGFFHVSPGTFNFSDDKSYVRYCNQTSGPVFYATARWENNQWSSHGWGKVESGRCENHGMGKYSGSLYVGGFWVDSGNARFWQGPAEFCIHSSDAFNYPFANSMSCNGNGQRRLGFFELNMGPGVHTFNFRP
jgi:uncharacterized membrane protein